jgi:hypothetical protein
MDNGEEPAIASSEVRPGVEVRLRANSTRSGVIIKKAGSKVHVNFSASGGGAVEVVKRTELLQGASAPVLGAAGNSTPSVKLSGAELEDDDEEAAPTPAVRQRRGSSFRKRRGSSFGKQSKSPKTPDREFDDGMFISNLDITAEEEEDDEMDGELLRVKQKKLPKEFKAGGLPSVNSASVGATFDEEDSSKLTKGQRQQAKIDAHKAAIRAKKEGQVAASTRADAIAAKEEALAGAGASGCCGRMKRKGPSAKKKRAIEIADSSGDTFENE